MADDTLAVLGAGGTMGLPMSRNIARAGIQVRAWNRTRGKAEALRGQGAEVCGSPAEAARGATLLLTMLADGDAVLERAEEALSELSSDAIWLQMSTIGEQGTDRCIELARDHGVAIIDAPVLGTKQPAEEGKLVVLASGPTESRQRVQPIFDAVGSKTLWVGEPGASTRLKLATNSWVLAVTEGCAETIAFAQGMGVDPALLFDAFEGGPLDLPYFRMKGKAILERDFEPMFTLKLAAKDARLVEEAAGRRKLELPLFGAIRSQMEQAAQEHGDEDMSATWFASAPTGIAA